MTRSLAIGNIFRRIMKAVFTMQRLKCVLSQSVIIIN